MSGRIAIKLNDASALEDCRGIAGRLPLQAVLQIAVQGSRIATHISVSTYAHPAAIAEKRRHAFRALPAQARSCALLTEKQHHSGRVQLMHDERGPPSRRRKPGAWADMRADRRLYCAAHVIMLQIGGKAAATVDADRACPSCGVR